MDRLKYLQLQTLERHLENVQVCEIPSGGWIKAIRKSFSMSVRQLAERLGITQQSTARLENNEMDGSITIKSLRKVADALDCELVYALVPRQGSLKATIEKQAYKKAREIVLAVNHSMELEAQGVNNVEEKIEELAGDLSRNLKSKLWDII